MPILPPPGRARVAVFPQRCSLTSETFTCFDFRSLKVAARSSHMRKSSCWSFFSEMERGLKWRHGENQPAVAGVTVGKPKHIAKKGSVGFGVLGIDNDVRSIDQAWTLLLRGVIFSLRHDIHNGSFAANLLLMKYRLCTN
jgi:hypothetical protein